MPTLTCNPTARRRHLRALPLAAVCVLCACSTASPSPEELAALIEPDLELYLDSADDGGRVRAVLIQHEGRPVIARYAEATPDDYWDTQSVTKSVVSALIGVAIEERHIDGVDQTLGELLPSRAHEMSAETAAVTLEQVLTHTAGFPAETSTDEWLRTDDQVGAILAGREHPEPQVGSFAYSDAGAHLAAAVLAESTGVPVLTYARDKLFNPLGIDTEPAFEPHFDFTGDDASLERMSAQYVDYVGFVWPVDSQGLHVGTCCAKLRPQDLAALGQLYLDEGRWEGEQLLPAEWVRVSTQAHVQGVGMAGADAYGYLWWVDPGEDDTTAAFMAFGRGGQFIHVTPDAGLVVAVATEYDQRDPTYLANQFHPDAATRMVELAVLPHVQP